TGLRPLSAERMLHNGQVSQFEFSADGNRLVTASGDSTARIWNPETGSPLIPSLRHPGLVYESHFSPDGQSLLTVWYGAETRLWELRSGRGERSTLTFPVESNTKFYPSPDGRHVAVFDHDGSAQIRETATGRTVKSWREEGPLTACCFDRDGARFL